MFQFLTSRVLEPPAFGLDISDLTVKFSRLARHGGSLFLEAFGELNIPEGVVVGGEIKNEAELAAILKAELRAIAGRRLGGRYCVASLPEEKSFVRVIELPNMKLEEAAKAVRWEVEGAIPLPLEELYFDYEFIPRLPGASDHLDALITAFPKNLVESYHRVLVQAGLIPLALELESQAISRSLITRDAISRPVIIIDLGATRTSFIIFAAGTLLFTKSIAVGGRTLETAIAASLGVPLEEARAAKISAGLRKSYREGRVFAALRPHLGTLSNELEQQLWFYREHPAKRHPGLADIERVILCGGDANLIGLATYLSTAIKKRTVLGDPFATFGLPPGTIPPVPHNQSLKYTTAIGLALRAAGR